MADSSVMASNRAQPQGDSLPLSVVTLLVLVGSVGRTPPRQSDVFVLLLPLGVRPIRLPSAGPPRLAALRLVGRLWPESCSRMAAVVGRSRSAQPGASPARRLVRRPRPSPSSAARLRPSELWQAPTAAAAPLCRGLAPPGRECAAAARSGCPPRSATFHLEGSAAAPADCPSRSAPPPRRG